MKTHHRSAGFTLSETLIALTVFSLLMTGVTTFYLQTTKAAYASAQRLALVYNLRRFSDELLVHASRANESILYVTSEEEDRESAADDRLTIDVSDSATLKHPAGDFIVFVYYKIPKPTADTFHRIAKIEGYFLADLKNGTGNLRKVEIVFKVPSSLSVEEALKANWKTAKFTDFALNIRGLSYSEKPVADDKLNVPRLFYKNDSRAVMVTGQIFQANGNKNTQDWKTYTQSFNFVVTPRS